jgi:hypothetical protein
MVDHPRAFVRIVGHARAHLLTQGDITIDAARPWRTRTRELVRLAQRWERICKLAQREGSYISERFEHVYIEFETTEISQQCLKKTIHGDTQTQLSRSRRKTGRFAANGLGSVLPGKPKEADYESRLTSSQSAGETRSAPVPSSFPKLSPHPGAERNRRRAQKAREARDKKI